MRNLLYNIRNYSQGNIEKHIVMSNYSSSCGVAEHSDHIETIDKELGKIAEFEDRLEVLNISKKRNSVIKVMVI